MAAFSSGTGLRRRLFATLSLIAAVITIAVGAFLWQAVELGSLATVSERVDQAKPLMNGLRLALIGSLAAFWPRFSFLGARSDTANETTRARWMALRWHVVGWMLVIELIIGQSLFGRFVTLVANST